MKYKPKRDIPRFVRKYKTFSPSELREIILRERNKAVSPESISNWFRRHPDIKQELEKEIVEEEKPKEEVGASIFENGTFEELDTVKTWINEQYDRVVSPKRIKANVSALKRICQGRFRTWGIDLVQEGFMSLQHPDRLQLDDFTRLERELRKRGKDTATIRLPARNFFTSKGIVVGSKISGSKSKGYGSFADLRVSKPVLKAMLDHLKQVDFQAYAVDLFMYKTATRITATLNALIENYRQDLQQITVKDKGRHKTPEKRVKRKYVDPQLGEVLTQVIGERKVGKIFSIDSPTMGALNRQLIETYSPETLERYPNLMPNHFWRHMFAQHMLTATNWNYAVVANLGGWTIKALEESYGKPPLATIKDWEREFGRVLAI
jgi:integrase